MNMFWLFFFLQGFEDVLVLDDILAQLENGPTGPEINNKLAHFTQVRGSDAHAICELAMYNYLEMRHLVNNRGYYFRRMADVCLHKLLGSAWVPLYNNVTFSRISYSQCIIHRQWQDDVRPQCKFK